MIVIYLQLFSYLQVSYQRYASGTYQRYASKEAKGRVQRFVPDKVRMPKAKLIK